MISFLLALRLGVECAGYGGSTIDTSLSGLPD